MNTALPYSRSVTTDDIAGLSKFVRALHPQWLAHDILRELQRDGVTRPDGSPLTPKYVGKMVVRDMRTIRAHAQTRRSRLLVARERGRHTREEWLDMIAVFKGLCVGCGRRCPVTKDHIIPLCAEGSSDGIDNIQPLCRPCNSSGRHMDRRDKAKTAWTPVKIQALRSNLGETVEAFAARFGRSGRTVEDWEQGRRRPDVMVLLAMQKLSRRFERFPR